MPNVAGKEYKYTKKGMAQAKAAAKKTGMPIKSKTDKYKKK
jgi:hypothetical protein